MKVARNIVEFLADGKELFLLSLVCLLFMGRSALSIHSFIEVEVSKENTNTLNNMPYKELTCLKPFTSLVSFSSKFSKSNKHKNKETRTAFCLPAVNL